MSKNIIYRKVKSDEIEQYHNLCLICLKNYPQNFGTLYEDELKSSSFKFDKIIHQNKTADFLMGAFKNEKLIGICGFIQEKVKKKHHIGEISGMYVMTEFSGQKIGEGLLNATIQTAFNDIPELEQIALAVVEKNKSALNLYKKNGFVEYGRLPNYFKYEDQYETLIFMVLQNEKRLA